MSYVRTLTICLLLVYFESAAGCHCFDFYASSKVDYTLDQRFPYKESEERDPSGRT